jgi:uncharacterized protein (TIGR02466 family)
MIQHNLFATPIQVFQIVPTDKEYAITNEILYKIYQDCEENVWALEDGKSTGQHSLDLHGITEFNWLTSKTLEYVKEFWKTLKYREEASIFLDSSWANLHGYGHATGEHSHYGGSNRAHISAVYYFKKPENSGNIEFVDPLEYIHRMTPAHEFSEVTGVYYPIDSKQFDLILFPSWLYHRTQKNLSREDRIAISMNFIGKWPWQ